MACVQEPQNESVEGRVGQYHATSAGGYTRKGESGVLKELRAISCVEKLKFLVVDSGCD